MQSVKMHKQLWVFAGRTYLLLGLTVGPWPICLSSIKGVSANLYRAVSLVGQRTHQVPREHRFSYFFVIFSWHVRTRDICNRDLPNELSIRSSIHSVDNDKDNDAEDDDDDADSGCKRTHT